MRAYGVERTKTYIKTRRLGLEFKFIYVVTLYFVLTFQFKAREEKAIGEEKGSAAREKTNISEGKRRNLGSRREGGVIQGWGGGKHLGSGMEGAGKQGWGGGKHLGSGRERAGIQEWGGGKHLGSGREGISWGTTGLENVLQ